MPPLQLILKPKFSFKWKAAIITVPLYILLTPEHPLTCVVQVEGQDEVQENVWKLLRGIRGVPVLHHAQKELNKISIQVF